MKSILSFALMALMAFFINISCQKTNADELDNNSGNNDNSGNKPIEYVTATVSGRITDENNIPVNGAAVNAGNASATTDINGNFKISNVRLDKNAGFVKVEKEGYFLGSRTIVVNAGVENYVSVQLIKKIVAGTVSNSGGNITIPSGGSISFQGGSFINTSNNAAYTGTVSVSAFYINPAASNLNEIMPGALRGINTSNEEMVLQSFGMMAVELTGSGGEKLQIASGKTATISFPIPAALQDQAPATIPLWSFDDTLGLWKEEGTATKQGTNYVGTVSHFSFWNCDYPYGVVDFKAVIKDQNGNALYPALVTLKLGNDPYSSPGTGYTDSAGFISGKMPKNRSLQLNIYNKCNVLLHSRNVGPFASTADFGTITVNNAGPAQLTISGSVVTCNASAVTNGYVDIGLDNIHTRALITNGNFSITFTRCSSVPATAVITAIDLDKNQISPSKNISVTSGTATTGELNTCNTTASQYINFTLKGTNYSYVTPVDSIEVLSYNGVNWTIIAEDRNSNTADLALLTFNTTGPGTVPVEEVHLIVNGTDYIKQAPINLNITEYGPVGGYIGGNFSATLKDSLNASNTAPVNLDFRMKRYR